MKIHGLTVCVNYADVLAKGLATWARTLDSLIVVTTPDDHATHALCAKHSVATYRTVAFHERGARFNKGLAIAEAYKRFPALDWMLFFDADIEPPSNWRSVAERKVELGRLHGATRRNANGSPENDPDIAGFFHLCHVSDPNMQFDPIVDTHWYHAANYDTTFQNRWPKVRRVFLPIEVIHHGEPGKNWCGVGNDAAVTDLHAERRKRGGRWDHETVGDAP